MTSTNTAITAPTSTTAIPCVQITHKRFTASSSPQFSDFHQITSGSDVKKFLACGDQAVVSFVDALSQEYHRLPIATNSIVIVRRIDDSDGNVKFVLDVPCRAEAWDGMNDAVPTALPLSRVPAQPVRLRR